MNKNGRPITARTMVPDNGRFSKLDFTASDLSELNLAFGDSLGSTPTPPPTCGVFSTPTPFPPQMNNQNMDKPVREEVSDVKLTFFCSLSNDKIRSSNRNP